MIGIYKITNKINGKCYIGQSDNIKRRWKDHRVSAFYENGPHYNSPLYKAIRKYGLQNFLFEVLEECRKEELDDKEIAYIAKYNSYGCGYNQTSGGNGGSGPIKLNEQVVDEIIFKLKTTNDSNTHLAKEFDVSEGMIRAINNGDCWVKEGESYPIRVLRQRDTSGKIIKKNPKTKNCAQCGAPIWPTATLCNQCSHKKKNEARKTQRPIKMELAKMIVESSFEAVGKKLGVSGNAIAKWCKCYGIPHTKEQLKQWYYSQIGQEYVPPKSHRIKKPFRRAVNKIDLHTGEILEFFPSIKDANDSLQIKSKSHIPDVCSGKRKSAHGYGWEYA